MAGCRWMHDGSTNSGRTRRNTVRLHCGRTAFFAASLLLVTATVADDIIPPDELFTTEYPDLNAFTTIALPTWSSIVSTTSEATVPSTTVTLPQDDPFIAQPVFAFTSALYNATVPENSPGKTAVVPDERMGVRCSGYMNIRFKILSGDRDKFFKAEERMVGDFCFLFIRLRTNNNDVMNRERKDKFVIEVKGVGVNRETGQSHEANTTVIINVLDVNDLKPLFFQSEYEKKIPEDTPLHQSIIQMHAEDADLGRNGEVYYSFLESTEVFSIHPASGIVTLTRPLKYHEKSLYDLTVVAQDRGLRPSAGKPTSAKLRIRVNEVNLFAPEIYVHRLPELVENSSTSIYGVVRVVDKDDGVHGEIGSLEIVDGDPDGHFRLRRVEGGEFNIEVMRLIDRETRPLGYNLTLRTVDKGLPPRQTFKSVPIKIADLNDNPPVFDREIYEVDIPETSPINTPVIRLKVTDADDGKNAQVFLEIVGGNEAGEFQINPYTGMLYTAVMLDAEEKAFYTLTVSAIDQGNAGTRKQSSAKVKVNVVDTNDNDPTFEQEIISVEINENEQAGSSVLKVTAKDRDSDENAYISYSIANLNPVPFEIDHFSGVIRTTTVLDYESMRRNYILRVRASDWGLPFRRQSEMQVKIKVKDINDNRPQFEKVDCRGHVPRYVPIGTEIFTLSAIDFDANNEISYKLVSGNEDGCFALDATTGILSVTCDLTDVLVGDRTLNVTATDGTHFADVSRVLIHLVTTKRLPGQGSLLADESGAFECRDTGVARRLTEVLAMAEKNNMDETDEEFAMMPSRYGENVHTPEYLFFPNEIKINESAALGTTLLIIRARDRDLGYNGKLVYGISGGDEDSVFRIDAETGELKVIGYLDRERRAEYLLNITVYDLGKPQKSLSRILPITVLDVNDNAPKFEKSLASFRVTENANNGTAIFRVNATDADEGDNAKVTYSLVTDTIDFAVDPTQGILYVSNALDRERQDVYELKIRATDGGSSDSARPPLFSDALVRIIVDDINDNAPAFPLPTVTVKVREDIPTGTVVAVITATDPDVGEGGDVRYSLAPETDGDGVFVIDKLTGSLRTAKPLDFEERQMHSLVVRAKDRGTPALSSETTVLVEVVDVNENAHAPLFADFVWTASVKENRPVGTVVTTVTAVDDDPHGDDSTVSYSIRGGDGLGMFTIDDKGQIRTSVVLDIETKDHYWLTVYAQDRGVVPMHSRLEVYVAVENVNDNAPLTDEPVYFASIAENSGPGKPVVVLHATDLDVDPNNTISYRITSGNPESYFTIDQDTGVIKTTSRKLDRENQAEHVLEVRVSDSGSPPLSTTTRVIVSVEDVNDHSPAFDQPFYKVLVPASLTHNAPLYQNGSEPWDLGFELEPWDLTPITLLNGTPVFRVLAHDEDTGPNGELEYSMKSSGKGKGRFKVHPKTGVVYSTKPFQPGQEYDLMIRASDKGVPPKIATARVSLSAVGVGPDSEHVPVVKSPHTHVQVTETDQPGYLVALVQATDEDSDRLWYNIVDGDTRNEFFIGRDNGNILLAKSLDWETQHHYNLTISVTDGVHTVYTQLHVMVVDSNDHRPEFSRRVYSVDISENVPVGTEVMEFRASDLDENDKVLFSLHAARSASSLELFRLDSVTGSLSLVKQLDRETSAEHVLIVEVKDQGTPAQKNYARVHVHVHDHNDHAPMFASPIIQAKVFETAEVGTTVARVLAVDRDRDVNARISYSIISGNVGNVFSMDPTLGDLELTRQLDYSSVSEYMLMVRASDSGNPPMASSLPIHVMVTMADNAPPRFLMSEVAAEMMENQPMGTFVARVEARATSSVIFELVAGNSDDTFLINPSTGVVLTKNALDYEKTRLYNLTVEATNMAGVKARCHVVVHILDCNDNPPRFIQAIYSGHILESALLNSLVLTDQNTPLVIKATDPDSELNALLSYEIVEVIPRRYFHIDSSTGAIRTVMNLDHETLPNFTFHVRVSDVGKPRLSSDISARVDISVVDVNDCAPEFVYSDYNATLLLPTYAGVGIIQLEATDRDVGSVLRYDLIEGNVNGAYRMDPATGMISVHDPAQVRGVRLTVRVSDGKFSTVSTASIRVERSESSGLVFQKSIYTGAILENSTKISVVTVVNVLGSVLNEHVVFTILNPSNLFVIGKTSGVIRTSGRKFDREVKDLYSLIVEARSSEGLIPRIAHVVVNVTILDINDNCPMFVNLPYYAVISVTAVKGDVVSTVHAIDLDKGENGEVRYELIKGHGELFKVCRKTGEISLKQSLEGHNSDYELLIAAYDGGIAPCSTEVPVRIKVIDRSMPVFDKHYYSVNVAEDMELHSPLSVSITAESPLGRKLIYSLVSGNDYEEFALDFNTAPDTSNTPCFLYVVDNLDYETKKEYKLVVRATDGVSGVFAEVLVNVRVTDVNDCPPEFTSDTYNVSVSEAAPFGTSVLKVKARDNDTGINEKIRYELHNDGNSSVYFHVEPDEGVIYLKRSLDAETHPLHHLTVVATDQGMPSLSSTAHVWVSVIDMNDNAPKFEQPSYTSQLSQEASRGQFVTVVTASDADLVDINSLVYTIVGGNDMQVFAIDPASGIISLMNLQNFGELSQHVLNVSVSDGVYTSFTRVRIDVQPSNRHNPTFPQPQIDVKILENLPKGTFVANVKALDKDKGPYGEVTYAIASTYLADYFEVNSTSGEVRTRRSLDRETARVFEVPITGTDAGGRLGFVTLRVNVMDVNDNDPMFVLRELKTAVASNLPLNSGFYKVKATDADDGANAELEFTLLDPTRSATELFSIHAQSGGLHVISDLKPHEGKAFQFFVRVEDHGKPARRYAHLPVEVVVMSPDDQAPMFERKDDKFFMSEDAEPGAIITKLKMVSNTSVSYRLVSGDQADPQFLVDSSGQVTLARPLDRETADSHVIAVMAETGGSPSLAALAEIGLGVLDMNDHAPKFESSPYYVTVAENLEEGSQILRVIAHDADQGNNREVRYSLAPDSGDLANIFAVNPYTGWVRTLATLDRETKAEYTVQVVATDNGNTKHFARTSVIVTVKDYNDNPPVFSSQHYKAAVNEDALPGTVVLEMKTTDKDELRSSVEFHITGGDSRSQFQVRRTGELFVAKPLDRESLPVYHLIVTATDGKFVIVTKVTVDILDANDNPPYCLRHRYREILSEGVQAGTYVLTVLASDQDEPPNADLRFYLTGDGSEHFVLDKAGGHLKTALPLDREDQSRYQLIAHVQDRDRPGWECSSLVDILISDLNDNVPAFAMDQYSATLSEDAQVGTLVTKLHATDRDIGINRKVKYALLDSAGGHFKVEPDSGIVTLAKPLDRELKASYNLSAVATDEGTPQLSRNVRLFVHVLDVNDNPPEFASRVYYATVPESEHLGYEILRVLATSKDLGVNAQVFYSIVGGNEHKKFAIDSNTGVISIAEPLDYERAKDYLLTIQGIDGGVPPLSNHATVNITVTDSNDNVPLFTQNSYTATIRENAQIGDKILQVMAHDLDSNENGRVTYSMGKGDRSGQFSVDPVSGYLAVQTPLDREMISSYVIEVEATDHGVPQHSSVVNVNLDISDENDNPPVFTQANYTAVVQEDKPPGHTILTFHVTDADSPPNTSPFTFDFRWGNDDSRFKLTQEGQLQTAYKLNHRAKDSYLLHVRVFDNGTPPMYSDTQVLVRVIEESQYPPTLTPLEVTINSFRDAYPGGVIGRLHATDQDQYDTLTYALSSPTSGLFDVSPEGVLSAQPLDVGDYVVNVTVTDDKFTTPGVVKIAVEMVTEEMLAKAVVIRFRDVSPQGFVLSHRKGFYRALRNTLGVRVKDIVIISVQPAEGRKRSVRGPPKAKPKTEKIKDKRKKKGREVRQLMVGDLDVLFAVRNGTWGLIAPEKIQNTLSSRLDAIEQSTGIIVEEIGRDRCGPGRCVFGKCIDKFVLESLEGVAVSTDFISFVSPRHHQRVQCLCREGYAGDHCELAVNECSRSPCPPSKLCIPDGTEAGFSCVCRDGQIGESCEVTAGTCTGDGCYGRKNPISFSGNSYAEYQLEKGLKKTALEEAISLSLWIRTVQESGNLMYAAGKIDYNILEIVNGVVQYRFELGTGEGLVRVSSISVSDGQWHEIRLERDGNTARVVVDRKHVATGSSPGINDILNTQSDVIFLGAEVHTHPVIIGFNDVRRGFIGCLDDVSLSRVSVPLYRSDSSVVATLIRFHNVNFNCDPGVVLVPLGVCGAHPCLNGGLCKAVDDSYTCGCHDRFVGDHCERDSDPCASSPCLNGGVCKAVDGGYVCQCPNTLSGARCQFGKFCSPNPCRNGGLCEEGDTGPLCKCRGYAGPLCSLDVDECLSGPCLHGATCMNVEGGYTCHCHGAYSGPLCATPLYSAPITSSYYNLTLEELIGIFAVLGIIVVLVLIFVVFRKMRTRRNRSHGNHINNDTRKDIVLNSAKEVDFKRGSKLSNLEVSQRDTPPRPASYAAASDPHLPPPMPLNNLDTLRSYGSAGDELEAELPPDYLRNLNRGAGGEVVEGGKPAWGAQPLASYSEHSIKNDLKLGNGGRVSGVKVLGGRPTVNSSEEAGYHWDCSDWAQRPLPNITEVPGSEVPDSSSFHSNESNESHPRHPALPPVLGPIDPARDIDTLPEDQDSEVPESDMNESDYRYPESDPNDSEYRFHEPEAYRKHPNSYLPRYNMASASERDDSDEDYGYGFPKHEGSALLGSLTNVCEIDDADLEELKQLNPRGVVHTAV